MISTRIASRGHIGAVIVAVAVVALVGLVGWRAWVAFHKDDATTNQSTTSNQDLKATPEVKSTGDLKVLDEDLGNLNTDSGDQADLNAQLNY